MSDKQMSDAEVEAIVELVVAWPLKKKFGWEEMREEIGPFLKAKLQLEKEPKVLTRQQLCKYLSIKNAFEAKKKKVRIGRQAFKEIQSSDKRNLTPKELALTEQLEARDAKILELTQRNDSLHEKFERWVYNASAKGVSEEMLNQPLPKPSSKQPTKKSLKPKKAPENSM